MQNLNVKEDVLHQHHLNLKTHVTAKLLQYKNVEMEQQADLQDVETTKLLIVTEDVILTDLHQTHVIVKLKL
jgi:hypothetical protein